MVDLAKAHVVAITRMVEDRNKEKYEIFNVGTGNGVSVLELVRSFERVNDLKLNYKNRAAPRGRRGGHLGRYLARQRGAGLESRTFAR